jgi:ribonuclease HII
VASLALESDIVNISGIVTVAGLDEAGRGALAGPVVAAAVILPLRSTNLLARLVEVNDSKQLSARKRAELYEVIREVAVAYGVGARSSHYIDSHGIIAATKQAMLDALQELHPPAEYLLIDGRIRLKQSPIPQQAIIRGDSISLSIAAASILAKVTRDRFMIALDGRYPEYGFASHKGYGTEHHRTMLSRLGPTPEHRLTFAPLKATLL